jgi:hypothetical protein
MGYKFIPLSATPYGAVGKPVENFLVLYANRPKTLVVKTSTNKA